MSVAAVVLSWSCSHGGRGERGRVATRREGGWASLHRMQLELIGLGIVEWISHVCPST